MKNLFRGLISTTKSLGEKLENYTLIIDKTWLWVNPSDSVVKTSYIFRGKNDELLISLNGRIDKGKWEYIKNSNCLLIELDGVAKLFQILYIREHYLVFQNDFDPTLFVFVNESFYRNKYAKLNSKILDSVLRDIVEIEFIKSLAPKTLSKPNAGSNTSLGKSQVQARMSPIVQSKESESGVQKEEPKEKESQTIDDSLGRLDKLITRLENHKRGR